MRDKVKNFLTSELFVTFLYLFARAYSFTFRMKVENEEEWMEYLKNGGTVLICGWHQQFFSAIRHFPKYKTFRPSVMVSQSKDGEIGAGVARRAGWVPVRGSSSRGGREALKMMIANLKETRLAGHVLDGPRGPMGKVKPGAIRLAQAAGAVIVPFYVRAENGWQFNSWDKFLLPKPFSRVTLCFGKMINLEEINDEESFEKQRKRIEDILLPELKL